MADLAIQVVGLGKRYQIGERLPYKSLRETLTRVLAVPFGGAPRTKRETIWALRDVSFDVKQGEVVGVIGRNGAGKSTLLKILARITEPTCGTAQIRGRVASLLEVGTGFHPELTGRENIFLSGAVLGMKRAEIVRRFDEIVAFAEVEQFIDTPVKWYSSGMYLRLAFAVAAHLQPEILLVDEILAVGDAAFQKKCLGRMGEVARGGRTVLFVSHNLAAVRKLCNRGMVLEAGRVSFTGETSECVNRYLEALEGGGTTDRDVSTEPRPRETLGKLLRLVRVRLGSTDGGPLCTGGALNLDVQFECREAVFGVVFGFSVFSADGPRIFQCLSAHDVPAIDRLEAGRYQISATVESNPLLPGRYTLDLGVRSATKDLDWVQETISFQVIEPPSVDVDYHLQTAGYIYAPSRWTDPVVERADDPSLHQPSTSGQGPVNS